MTEPEPRTRAHRARRWLPVLGAPLPLHPLLFAAYPILFLYSLNVDEVRTVDALEPLLTAVAAALGGTLALGLVLRDLRRAAIVVSALLLVFFSYGRIETVTATLGLGRTPTLLGLAVLVVGATIAALLLRRRLADATFALNGIGLVLVGLTLVSIVPHEVAAAGRRTDVSAAGVTGGDRGIARDIYYLVFDRYGSARSLELQYGLDNEPFLDWLRERGFLVASDSHASYTRTSQSLAATLNLQHLHELAAELGPDSGDQKPLFALLDEHEVGRFLKSRGYRYIHIGGWWGETRQSRIADVNTSTETLTDFSAVLYDASLLPVIAEPRAAQPLVRDIMADTQPGYAASARRAYESVGGQLRALREAQAQRGPKLVLAHVLLPHPPYVFAADGSFVETPRGSINEQFAGQLAYTNDQIRWLVTELLDVPVEQRPIIVLQADEGPYPDRYARDHEDFDWTRATADELEIKFGILNAWYAPELSDADVYPTITSVNTFRTLFAHYFGTDTPLLPDRSYASSGARPHDLIDITDRLPSLAGE